MQIFNYGSVNIDHVYRVPHLVQPGETLSSTHYQRVLGGKGANQSIALARAGSKVSHIGRYHHADDWVRRALQSANVQCEHLKAVDVPSGHAIIQVDTEGENAIVLYAGANHSFLPEECLALLKQTSAQRGDWLLLQNECSVSAEMIESASQLGMKVAFNPAPMTEEVRHMPLHKISVLFVNEIEVMALLQLSRLQRHELPQQIMAWLPDVQVIVTLGADGVLWTYQGQSEYMPALPVDVVDTTGAGDTFVGYYLHAMLSGKRVRDCLAWATQAAALCVQQAGASISIPTALQVRHALQGDPL